MRWDVELHADFIAEFERLTETVQDELLAHIAVLEEFGPQLGRPRVDTEGLAPREHEGAPFRRRGRGLGFAFAFDPTRRALVLCGGDKSGGSKARFYRKLIARADARFDAHLVVRRPVRLRSWKKR
jgi:hypothetical protein